MVILNVLIIFLIISIQKIDEFCSLYRFYTSIGGSIFCKYSGTGYAFLFITKNPHSFHERHPLDEKQIYYGGSFYLSAKVKQFVHWKPRLYLKIIHNCVETNFDRSKKKKPILKKYVLKIPQLFISKNAPHKCFFYRGKIDLARRR